MSNLVDGNTLETIIDGIRYHVKSLADTTTYKSYWIMDTQERCIYLYNVKDQSEADNIMYQAWLYYKT